MQTFLYYNGKKSCEWLTCSEGDLGGVTEDIQYVSELRLEPESILLLLPAPLLQHQHPHHVL
jgi:hypothetical protein